MVKLLKISRLVLRYKRIPKQCPNCSEALPSGDSIIKNCKRCKAEFTFGYKPTWFGGYWFVEFIKDAILGADE